MTLKLPFIIKTVTEMDYSVKMTSKRRTILLLLFVFAKNHIFTFLTLGLTLKLTLHITLNSQNNTLNRFSSQNPMKKSYYTFRLLDPYNCNMFLC